MRLRLLLLLLVTGVSLIAAPAASAAVTVGQVLSTTTGGWANSPTSFAYQWRQCDAGGSSCTNTGTNSSSYTVQVGDVGHTIRVIITATNASGSGSVTAAPTVVVTAAGGASNNVAPTIAASCTSTCSSSSITWGADANATSFTGQYGGGTVASAITRPWTNPAETFGFPATSLTIPSVTVGDIVVVAVGTNSTGQLPTSVSCACASGGFTAISGARFTDTLAGDKKSAQLWWGLVTSTGTSSVTTTGGPGTGNVEIIADDLRASSAGATWATDGGGTQASASPPMAYPSLTPSQNSQEVYWGYGKNTSGLTTGGTACTTPFACFNTADSEQTTWNLAAASGTAAAPAGKVSAGGRDAAAAVFYAYTGSSTTVANVTSAWSPTPQCGKTVPYQVASEGPAGELFSNTVNVAWAACGGGNARPTIAASCTSTCSSSSITWGADANATSFTGAISTASSGGTTTYTANITSPWVLTPQCGQTLYYDVASTGSNGDLWYSLGGGASRVAISWAACPAGGAPEVGINPGGGSCCGTSVDQGMKNQGIAYARVDVTGPGPPSEFYGVGLKVVAMIPGNCSGSSPGGYISSGNGVADINASAWASCAQAVWQNDCGSSSAGVSHCPYLEILNEPGGSWFWGNANTQSSATNYARILQDTWTVLHNTYGAGCDVAGTCPKILGSYDGGGAGGGFNWGAKVVSNGVGITVANYLNDWTLHPYGDGALGNCSGEGSGLAAASTASDDTRLDDVTNTHTAVGSTPIYITEVGWQTGGGQCSGQQQADNLYGLFQYARAHSYIAGIDIFNYSDYGGVAWGLIGNGFGTSTIQGAKPAWTAIGQVASNMAGGLPNSGCTVC